MTSEEPRLLFERVFPQLHGADALRGAVIDTWAAFGLTEASPEVVAAGIDYVRAMQTRWEFYSSVTYFCTLDRRPEHGLGADTALGSQVWHLMAQRHDGETIEGWSELQAIKTAVLGADVEAVELYPAEARLVDTANVRHLFAFPGTRLPFGFASGLRAERGAAT